MPSRAKHQTKSLQERLLLDASARTSGIVIPAKQSMIFKGGFLDCEKRCKPYLRPSR